MSDAEKSAILNELEFLRQRMDSLFSENFGTNRAHSESQQEAEPGNVWLPAADIRESKDEWVMIADLPGVADADLLVEVIDGQLIIRGRRETNHPHVTLDMSQEERPKGEFMRVFILPQDVQQDGIEAELHQGVLTVKVSRFRQSLKDARKVKIHAG